MQLNYKNPIDDPNFSDYTMAYADICNIVFRAMYPEWDEDDGLRHTSKEARRVAMQIFDKLGIEE